MLFDFVPNELMKHNSVIKTYFQRGFEFLDKYLFIRKMGTVRMVKLVTKN